MPPRLAKNSPLETKPSLKKFLFEWYKITDLFEISEHGNCAGNKDIGRLIHLLILV